MTSHRAPTRPVTSEPEGVVVVRADGTVESVDGHAPIEWVGRRAIDIFERGERAAEVVSALCESDGEAPRRLAATCRVTHDVSGCPTSLLFVLVAGIPLRPSLTRVDQLVLRVADVFIAQARHERIELDVSIQPGLPAVASLDEEKIAWALSTLVGNAIRHVVWKRETDEDPRVRLAASFKAHDERFVFRVSDNGRGIPAHEARWLFERNPATGKAAGLALLMMRDVVTAHRGSITVESVEGRGSTFTLSLPRR